MWKLPAWVNDFLGREEEIEQEKQFDIKSFKAIIEKIKAGDKNIKIQEIENLLSCNGLVTHHTDKTTGRIVLATTTELDYVHEHHTAKKLTATDYDVLFAPPGYFKRTEKKFDVFLTRGHLCLEADLKSITSTNPDTISNRIKDGSQQANRIVVDICSNVNKMDLIDGLRSGCEKNDLLIQIMLFYKSKFYQLEKSKILSKKIFDTLK